ncbi:hypothetical protein MH117_08180 [Paenibacillus sp. ACRRX]|uniref:hypothetical protein n=1 Tax=Paenibacillus sp. ACRRX TaxID=2918206 RepID=UPI001EF66B53|nr:hypothetical protein [Paenibacillus sp. ACRRX]MCG7407396.1 hypothetical protein [Paenibacillus sp. ACRRX]
MDRNIFANATGFKSVKSNITSDNGAIIVNNLDELAALLSYYADLENSANNSHPPISPFAPSSYTTVVEQTIWGDGLAAGANLSWITGVVKLKKDSDTNKILEIVETGSSLEGFHPGNSWVHNSAKTSYGIDSNKKSGWATIAGTRTLYVIIGGIGNLFSKSESYNMTF